MLSLSIGMPAVRPHTVVDALAECSCSHHKSQIKEMGEVVGEGGNQHPVSSSGTFLK